MIMQFAAARVAEPVARAPSAAFDLSAACAADVRLGHRDTFLLLHESLCAIAARAVIAQQVTDAAGRPFSFDEIRKRPG